MTNVSQINGLKICKNAITAENQKTYMDILETYKWRDDLKRQTQHYGRRYNYVTRTLINDCLETPYLISEIAKLLTPYMNIIPNQCIVNKYIKGERITPHIDAPCFGPIIITISLGSAMTMRFTNGSQIYDLILDGGDMIILSEDARYKWKHELLADNNENFKRISLTYRTFDENKY